ncbi:hypothetical protein [Marinovum sp.]|uniref:hypothetical protein n=1 Tax=Marinovum sp. TaxID=2024839 RepID=UPI002B279B2C|nr:hypothetical protein [Marinovum sp.]
MTHALTLLWRDNKLLLAGFVLALAVMAFFAIRTVAFWIYWADPTHRNQAIEPWMTPRYVAHSWHVPPEVVAEALDLRPGSGRITLAEIAARDGVSLEEIAARVVAAIEAERAAHRLLGPGPRG